MTQTPESLKHWAYLGLDLGPESYVTDSLADQYLTEVMEHVEVAKEYGSSAVPDYLNDVEQAALARLLVSVQMRSAGELVYRAMRRMALAEIARFQEERWRRVVA